MTFIAVTIATKRACHLHGRRFTLTYDDVCKLTILVFLTVLLYDVCSVIVQPYGCTMLAAPALMLSTDRMCSYSRYAKSHAGAEYVHATARDLYEQSKGSMQSAAIKMHNTTVK